MREILDYIQKQYSPLTVIIYGSYADGSHNLNSDFDALVITERHDVFHDISFVGDVQLDLFVYPASYFDEEVDYDEFIQIFDGSIIMDTDGLGAQLKEHVLEYIDRIPPKTEDEIRKSVEWCEKMFARVKRRDTEGMFRWHWVLTDSLEIFCDTVHRPYLGPKKALKWMEKDYPEEFAAYQKALFNFTETSLHNWITCLKKTD